MLVDCRRYARRLQTDSVVGLATLDKPTRQCGRSPSGSIDDIGFSLSLC